MRDLRNTDTKPDIRLILAWWGQAFMLRFLWWVVTPMSAQRASATGRRFMGWLGPRSRKHREVLANTRVMFPEKNETQIELLAQDMWQHLGATLAEFPHFPVITDMARPIPAIEIVCRHPDPDFLSRKATRIFVAPHLGNCDLSAFAVQHLGMPVDVVYNPQRNPCLEKMVQRKRTALRCGFIGKKNALRSMLRSLKAGRSVGLHVDVRIDGAERVPLFGLEAETTTAPAWLAMKTGSEIVPIHTLRVADARFRVTVHPPLPPPRTDLPEAEALRQTTADINAAIENIIRQHPGQWLRTKRRWPRDLMLGTGAYQVNRVKA